MTGSKTLKAQLADGTAKAEGNLKVLEQLASTMVDFDPRFEIMPGTKPKTAELVEHADESWQLRLCSLRILVVFSSSFADFSPKAHYTTQVRAVEQRFRRRAYSSDQLTRFKITRIRIGPTGP